MNNDARIKEIDSELAKLETEKKGLKKELLALHTPAAVSKYKTRLKAFMDTNPERMGNEDIKVVELDSPEFKVISSARVKNREARESLLAERRTLLATNGPIRAMNVVEAELATLQKARESDAAKLKNGVLRLQSERDFLVAMEEVRNMSAEKRAALTQVLRAQGVSSKEDVSVPGTGKR
jgi:hypothetical protein